MSETGNDENFDPAEAQARLDQLEEDIQHQAKEAADHGTLGPTADDGEPRFVESGDVDDPMNTQGIAPPA